MGRDIADQIAAQRQPTQDGVVTTISEEELRDRLVTLVDLVGKKGRLTDGAIDSVATEAWQLAGDAKQLHYERTRSGGDGE